MIQHCLFAILSVVLCIASSGCCLPRAYSYHGCDSGNCPSVETEVAYAHDSEDCVECGRHSRGQYHRRDKTWLHRTVTKIMTCGAGCGSIYWNEWYSDPPDECDPCNRHGDWTGPNCCPPRFRKNPFYFLWGHRNPDCQFGCEEPGCQHCATETGPFEIEELVTEAEQSPAEDEEKEVVQALFTEDEPKAADEVTVRKTVKKSAKSRPVRRVHYTARVSREH